MELEWNFLLLTPGMQLPKHICVLDIETYGIKRKQPEQTRLAFTGLKTYAFSSGRYRPVKHRVFSPEQAAELEEFLKAFEGVIVGHRLFHFDYRVLSSSICLRGIVEKSVDTRFTVMAHINRETPQWSFFHAGLDRLCRLNFGMKKTIDQKLLGGLMRESEFHLTAETPKDRAAREAFADFKELVPKFRPRKSDRCSIVYLKPVDGRLARTTKSKGFMVYVTPTGKVQVVPPQKRNPTKGRQLLRRLVRYNENDCDMTKRLWWALIQRRSIQIPCCVLAVNEDDSDTDDEDILPSKTESIVDYRMDSEDVAQLMGAKPPFTFDSWTEHLRQHGAIELKWGKRFYGEGNEILFTRCPSCGSFRLRQFDEFSEGCGVDGMTEGQLAEYMAGTWGTIICSKCGSRFEFSG